MIHIHKWTNWKLVDVTVVNERGKALRVVTKQEGTCSRCGRIKWRNP